VSEKQTSRFWWTYWTATAAVLAGAIAMAVWYAPVEATMGVVQKIFYVHLPSAINTFVACLVVFLASIGFLLERESRWDDLAAAAGRMAVGLCSIVLLTGMVWAKMAWNTWWTWSPRLTFSLLLWLLYVVYLILRASIDSGQRRGVVAAVYGIVAFLDVPLVYLSARLLPDIHPASIGLAPEMKLTLLVWFVPVTLINFGLIALAYRRRGGRPGGGALDSVTADAPGRMNLSLLSAPR
jgi:heme exporter protein C